MPTPRDADQEALSAYLTRIRGRLPSTASNLADLAGRATAMNDEGVDPQHFQDEFSVVIRSLHALGKTMDNASKNLADLPITGTDSRSLVEIRCTATLANLSVHLGPQAMKTPSAKLESAITEAFAATIAACRDVTLSTVEKASERSAERRR
jgi:DNA-binding protein YbaB